VARLLQRSYSIAIPTKQQIADTCLILLRKAIASVDAGRDFASFNLSLPSVDALIPFARFHALNDERAQYKQAEQNDQVRRELPMIQANADQSNAVQSVLHAVEGEIPDWLSLYSSYLLTSMERLHIHIADGPATFFLQGPGGTGKTFVKNHMLAASERPDE
jgi:hypothetical protein